MAILGKINLKAVFGGISIYLLNKARSTAFACRHRARRVFDDLLILVVIIAITIITVLTLVFIFVGSSVANFIFLNEITVLLLC